ncbi:hypothetical protein [Burkholderia gladioli]|uniref:hypothetical protein n=1 Tax=Burkholderia gladioli TaxID=28095 RepID=UPI001641F946|nr:hypothetical protein [Burkholderia gladioli]
MSEIEKRAAAAMHDAFCRLRYLSRRPLNESGRNYVFQISDAAHNIPLACHGNQFHFEHLKHDVLALEALLSEPISAVDAKYLAHSPRRVGLFQKLRSSVLGTMFS